MFHHHTISWHRELHPFDPFQCMPNCRISPYDTLAQKSQDFRSNVVRAKISYLSIRQSGTKISRLQIRFSADQNIVSVHKIFWHRKLRILGVIQCGPKYRISGYDNLAQINVMVLDIFIIAQLSYIQIRYLGISFYSQINGLKCCIYQLSTNFILCGQQIMLIVMSFCYLALFHPHRSTHQKIIIR